MAKGDRGMIGRLCVYEGIGDDLLFWAIIDTLFLTSVKGLTPSQISAMSFIAGLLILALYLPMRRIIRKAGDLNSMRIGAFLFLAAAILYTTGTHLLVIAFANFLYKAAFTFQGMSCSYIKSYLVSKNREGAYTLVFARADRLYSSISLVLAASAGLLFNLNPYIPMMICIGFCICALVLTFTFKELEREAGDGTDAGLVPGRRRARLDRNVVRCAVIIVVFSAASGIAFTNLELLFQERSNFFFAPEATAMLFSAAIVANRLARIALSFVSPRASEWAPLRERIFFVAPAIIAAALIIAVAGSLIDHAAVSLVLIAVGIIATNAPLMPVCAMLNRFLLEKSDSPQDALLLTGFMGKVFGIISSGLMCLILDAFSLAQSMAIVAAALLVAALVFRRWGRGFASWKPGRGYLDWEKTRTLKPGDYAKARKVLARHYGVYAAALARGEVCEYSFDRLKDLYDKGMPCAVVIDDPEGREWRPVLFVDDDGFVTLDPDRMSSVHDKSDPAQLLLGFSMLDEEKLGVKLSNYLSYLKDGAL